MLLFLVTEVNSTWMHTGIVGSCCNPCSGLSYCSKMSRKRMTLRGRGCIMCSDVPASETLTKDLKGKKKAIHSCGLVHFHAPLHSASRFPLVTTHLSSTPVLSCLGDPAKMFKFTIFLVLQQSDQLFHIPTVLDTSTIGQARATI